MSSKDIKRFRYFLNKRRDYKRELEIRPINSEYDYKRLHALIDACDNELNGIGESFNEEQWISRNT